MRYIVLSSISFYIISCNSESVNPCEKIELEEIINFEKSKSQQIQEKIYAVNASFGSVSFGYLKVAGTLTNVESKFVPVLNKLSRLINKYDYSTFLELQSEYEIIYQFSQKYYNISVLQPSILTYVNFAENNGNEQIRKYAFLNLYNDILLQELLIMEFKYDSLIYSVRNSISSERNPYEPDFVKILEVPDSLSGVPQLHGQY